MTRIITALLLGIGFSVLGLSQTDPAPVRSKPKPPRLLMRMDANYSAEGRLAGASGTVIFKCLVGVDGTVTSTKIVHAIGFGLDEKAERAVRQWRFEPGEKDGVPVPVMTAIEINFRQGGFGPDSLIFSLDPAVSRPELFDAPSKFKGQPISDPVVLDLEVTAEGECRILGVVRGSPHDANAVSKPVAKWRFRPALLNGQPVAVHGQLSFLLGQPGLIPRSNPY